MSEPESVDRAPLLAALGVPLEAALLNLALTHRSFAYEHGGLPTNERLEFLGDAVLGLIVTDELFRELPGLAEGNLAKLRAAVVNMRALADVARGIGLGQWLRLGRGEESTGGRDKDSILADTLEAVIGAVWVSGGLELSAPFVLGLMRPVVAASLDLGAGLDWKTSLQELAAERELGAPVYLVTETGPDHAKMFTAVVALSDREYGQGTGRSKKAAEQQAAEATYRTLREVYPATGVGPED